LAAVVDSTNGDGRRADDGSAERPGQSTSLSAVTTPTFRRPSSGAAPGTPRCPDHVAHVAGDAQVAALNHSLPSTSTSVRRDRDAATPVTT
jgi:hypothetical protein